MISAIIIDDELHCIERLSNLLQEHNKVVEVKGKLRSVEEGLKGIEELRPDLVFLDVMIHDKTGFDLLMQLPAIEFDLIFTTAFERYAVQAFKFSALDYLLKPIDPDDLKQAIDKVEKKKLKNELSGKLDVLFHNLKNSQGIHKRIAIPTMNGLTFVQAEDIIRCQSEVNYTVLFLKGREKLTVAKTLKEFEELLTEYNFYRVHNSHLINLAFVKSYNRGNGGFVCMTDNSEIEVASRRKEDFLRRLTS
ncbi:MAG: LytTR family DNA-binding domain-containing protein [Chitinophagaceae bacterium]